jgi:hypothetical protein
MSEPYLEVTFRRGRPIAAYYYLPRRSGDRSFRTARFEPGLVVDFNRGGRAIGIEITAPSVVTLTAMNKVLRELGFKAVRRAELAPLLAA